MVPEQKEYTLAKRAEVATAYSNALAAYADRLPKTIDALKQWSAAAQSAIQKGADLPPMPSIPPSPYISRFNNQGCIYNAMIYPLRRFPIKGVLWYQGDSGGIRYYWMKALINGWRKVWNQAAPSTSSGQGFPFYFVQMPGLGEVIHDPAGGGPTGICRVKHLLAARTIPNTGMAVTFDTTSAKEAMDAHPPNKFDIGVRLAQWALNRDYGQKNVVPSGPLYQAIQIEGNKARLTFDYVGSGLMIGSKVGRAPVVEDKAGKLNRFAICGADKKWVWADAIIDGNTVVVSSTEVKVPVAVRYAYSNTPVGANLYNREGLPASPFRTDDWDHIVEE